MGESVIEPPAIITCCMFVVQERRKERVSLEREREGDVFVNRSPHKTKE